MPTLTVTLDDCGNCCGGATPCPDVDTLHILFSGVVVCPCWEAQILSALSLVGPYTLTRTAPDLWEADIGSVTYTLSGVDCTGAVICTESGPMHARLNCVSTELGPIFDLRVYFGATGACFDLFGEFSVDIFNGGGYGLDAAIPNATGCDEIQFAHNGVVTVSL